MRVCMYVCMRSCAPVWENCLCVWWCETLHTYIYQVCTFAVKIPSYVMFLRCVLTPNMSDTSTCLCALRSGCQWSPVRPGTSNIKESGFVTLRAALHHLAHMSCWKLQTLNLPKFSECDGERLHKDPACRVSEVQTWCCSLILRTRISGTFMTVPVLPLHIAWSEGSGRTRPACISAHSIQRISAMGLTPPCNRSILRSRILL